MRWTDFMPLPSGSCRSFTSEGFLVCNGAVLARTGSQAYGPGETPLTGDHVIIDRPEGEVFHPEAIASAAYKPVCDDHPVDWQGGRLDITPGNWRQLAVGVCINPRRSEAEPDLLIGDLVIHDGFAIDQIGRGKTQLSCGYDADYFELGPGRGEQRNIRINHVALVDQGRCGIRCSIGDRAPVPAPCPCSDSTLTKRLVKGRMITHGPVNMANLYRAASLVARR